MDPQINSTQAPRDSQAGLFVARIRGLRQLFEQSIREIRGNLDQFEASAASEKLLRRADYWQTVIAYDSCVRLRQIIENNFHVIETLGLLATVRYIFELGIWLRLGTSRPEYALAYYGKLLEKECEYSKKMVRQLQREIELLETFEKRDERSAAETREKILEVAEPHTATAIQRIIRDNLLHVDREAARKFSLYVDQATTRGFGYTADLVRTQEVPKALERQRQASSAFDAFRGWCPADAKALLDRRWKWDRETQAAGMEGPYDFLYSYVSRLLHATPASVTTDVKNLEPAEIGVLLRYVHGALLDALDLVDKLRTKNTA